MWNGPSASQPVGDIVHLPYRNRDEGGRVLGERLREYSSRTDVVVLGLPRGGVPVAFQVARTLSAPLDVFLVRKLGVPGHEELAMGAIASGDIRVINREAVRDLRISCEVIEAVTAREANELARREKLYRGDRGALDVRGKTIILVDDGLATGSTMRAAVRALRQKGPARVVVGVPIASAETCADFQDEADAIVCAATPRPFVAVGLWYDDFSQTTDEAVRGLLTLAEHRSLTQ
jgi:putative phosphoribosyl transferase